MINLKMQLPQLLLEVSIVLCKLSCKFADVLQHPPFMG